MDAVQICDQEIQVKEYSGQRVVTFKDIDRVHGREKGTAKWNFNHNREHFAEGVDFFPISRKEFGVKFTPNEKIIGNPNVSMLLITESGYLMLCKSFTDELAWRVQRELVNCYFKIQQVKEVIREAAVSDEVDKKETIGLTQAERIKVGEVISKCPQYNMLALITIYAPFLPDEIIQTYNVNAERIDIIESKSAIQQLPSEFAETLTKALANNGMTQNQLAKILGCAKSTISQYVNGKSKPHGEQLQRIIEILNITF